MSRLRTYQKNPRSVLSTAFYMYRSKRIKTILVEGLCDKRFLSQWSKGFSQIRLEELGGKGLVEEVYIEFQNGVYSNHDFLYFFVDIDYDLIVGKPMKSHPCFIYNAYCPSEKKAFFNDLEAFLINSTAFGKFLANMDVGVDNIVGIRNDLEISSRIIGSLRVASLFVEKEKRLSRSLLNGIDLRRFVSPNLSLDKNSLYNALPSWSNYREYVDDLVYKAETINKERSIPWSLSRGHDLTDMLEIYFEGLGKKWVTAEKIELMLRLACEYKDFKLSPMGRQFSESGGLSLMNYVDEQGVLS